jgi:protein CMS1
MKQGADDLGDDFVVDDLVALSGGQDTFDGGFLSDSEEAHDAISSVEEADSDRKPQPNVKAGHEKKRKRREREKDRKAKVRDVLPVNHVELNTVRN